MADLAHDRRRTDVFWFLFDTLQPRVVVTHGADAKAHLERRLDVELPVGDSHPVETAWGPTLIRAEPHFSRGYSYDRADALGAEIARLIRPET